MTGQDKANIFDIVIKPFLCPDANNASQGTGNLFAEAIRTIFNAGSRKSANIIIQTVLAAFRADGQYKLADWLKNNIKECLHLPF